MHVATMRSANIGYCWLKHARARACSQMHVANSLEYAYSYIASYRYKI